MSSGRLLRKRITQSEPFLEKQDAALATEGLDGEVEGSLEDRVEVEARVHGGADVEERPVEAFRAAPLRDIGVRDERADDTTALVRERYRVHRQHDLAAIGKDRSEERVQHGLAGPHHLRLRHLLGGNGHAIGGHQLPARVVVAPTDELLARAEHALGGEIGEAVIAVGIDDLDALGDRVQDAPEVLLQPRFAHDLLLAVWGGTYCLPDNG